MDKVTKDELMKKWWPIIEQILANNPNEPKINLVELLESDASKLITSEIPFDTHGVPSHLHGPKEDDTVGTKKNEIKKNNYE